MDVRSFGACRRYCVSEHVALDLLVYITEWKGGRMEERRGMKDGTTLAYDTTTEVIFVAWGGGKILLVYDKMR
jgi:hypothetical protein